MRKRSLSTKGLLATQQPKIGNIAPIGIKPLAAQVGVGMLCASYWRGMWYILDDHLFPENPTYSGFSSLLMGTTGLAVSQQAIARMYQKEMPKALKDKMLPCQYSSLARFGSLYFVSISCVLVWRGTWVLWDVASERIQEERIRNNKSLHYDAKAGFISHGVAIAGLLLLGRFSSVLAPPSKISILKDITFKTRTRTWEDYSKAAKWFFK